MPLGYQVHINFKEKQLVDNKLNDFWFYLVSNFLDIETSNFKELKNRKGIISDKIFFFDYPKEYKPKSDEILFFKGKSEADDLELNLQTTFSRSEKPNSYFFKIKKDFKKKAEFYNDSKNLQENLLTSDLIPEVFRLSFLFFKSGAFGSIFGPTVGETFCLEFFENKLKVQIIKSGIKNKNNIDLNEFYLFSSVNKMYDNFCI